MVINITQKNHQFCLFQPEFHSTIQEGKKEGENKKEKERKKEEGMGEERRRIERRIE